MSLDARITTVAGSLAVDLELHAEPGETVAILGPNGAGKTTVLRTLAGLHPLVDGRVELNGRVIDEKDGPWLPPEERNIGWVAQDHVLFPHLDVVGNVAFGLRSHKVGRASARAQATAWLERVGLEGREHDRVTSLSGGESQRVALARALIGEPELLLLDEPLAALDVSVRAEVRRELKRHLDGVDSVRVLVTHDPIDAAVLADRIVVLEAGHEVQQGTLADLAARPRSPYVADLVGVNLLVGRCDGATFTTASSVDLAVIGDVQGPAVAVIHPRAVVLHREHPEGSSRNVWQARVDAVDPEGERVRVLTRGPIDLIAEVTAASVAGLGLAPGVEVWVAVKATEVTVDSA